VSNQGTQIALLTVTAAVSVADAETAAFEASDVSSKMASAPIDPTDQLQPVLAIESAMSTQTGFQGILDRLDGFMKLADLIAEARSHNQRCSATL
jgi:hypothetical protein